MTSWDGQSIVYSCGLSCHSYINLYNLSVRGRVNIFVVVIALITVLAVLPVGGGVGGIIRAIVGSFLSLEERAPVSVSDVETPGIAACKKMYTVDEILWEG